MKRKLTNEEVERLIDTLEFNAIKENCDTCILCSANNGLGVSCTSFADTGIISGCDAIKVALKSALLPEEEGEINHPLPTKEEVVSRLSSIVDIAKAEFPNVHIVHDSINRCWIDMDENTNPDRQTSKPIPYQPPWTPRCDGTELVWTTNDDRPARKGDQIWYLLRKNESSYDVKPSENSATIIRFKSVSPVQPEDFE